MQEIPVGKDQEETVVFLELAIYILVELYRRLGETCSLLIPYTLNCFPTSKLIV